ncbi:MAG: serine/threonine-protein kinase [Myxococcaceae bacterium]|nr:serine/threonine-protein kinase [Myxococcaceae bacterium]
MESCPSEVSLALLVRTGESLSDDMLEHIDACRGCRKVVAALAPSVPEPADTSAQTVALPLSRGSSVGRYLILELLGVGGMGTVWAAYDPQLDRKVALKLVRASSVDSPQARAGLLQEAQAMAKLNHPNVRAIYDAGLEGDQAFLVMELVEGENLNHFLATPRSWREVARLFLDAGRGLAAAHRVGLTHRDFKPDNILLSRDGRVLVTDFGLAHSSWSRVRGRVGTVAFMAPEQRRGEGASPLSDQFSYCLAFETALSPDAPTWLRRLLETGLQPDPAKRHSSLEVFLQAVDRRLSRRPMALAVAAVAVGLAVLGLTVSNLYQRSQVCAGAEDALLGVWDADVQRKAELAFSGTGLGYARSAWNTVRAELDGFARRWVAEKTRACEATRIRKEQSVEMLDARMNCFEARRTELGALTALLTQADATVVENASQASVALSRRGWCEGTVVAPAPKDAAQLQRAQGALASARALSQAGKYAAALPRAEEAVTAARAAVYPAVLASALVELGGLLGQKGSYPEAEKTLREAVRFADRAGSDATRAEAWLALTKVLYESARKDDAFEAGESALAISEGLTPEKPALAAAVELGFGKALTIFDRPAQALERYQKARSLAATDKRLALQAQAGIGNALKYLGREGEAEPILREVLESTRLLEGEEHPATATAHFSLADVLKAERKLDEAIAHYQEALRLRIAAYGPGHRSVAAIHNNVSTAYKDLGQFEAARVQMTRALEISEALDGPDHPRVALTLSNLGNLLLVQGDVERAVALHRRALKIFEAKPIGPFQLAAVHINLSNALLRSKQALAAVAEARAALGALPDKTHRLYPEAALALADALWEAGEKKSSQDEYQRLEKLLESGAPDRELKAFVMFGRAKGLVRSEPERAQVLAAQARDMFKTDPTRRFELAQVDEFLAGQKKPQKGSR